jgi:hypothetical protein
MEKKFVALKNKKSQHKTNKQTTATSSPSLRKICNVPKKKKEILYNAVC